MRDGSRAQSFYADVSSWTRDVERDPRHRPASSRQSPRVLWSLDDRCVEVKSPEREVPTEVRRLDGQKCVSAAVVSLRRLVAGGRWPESRATSHPMWSALASHLTVGLMHASPEELSSTAWALASLRCDDHALVSSLFTAAREKCSEFGPAELSEVMWGTLTQHPH